MDFDDPPMFKNCVHSHSKPSMPDWVFRRCKKRTISQAPLHHTDVQTLTIKYMMAYLKERRLLDPLPSSWKFEEPPVQLENLIEIQKDSIHFYDGDSAEVFLSHQDNPQLLALATHENAIRIRMKNLPHESTSKLKLAWPCKTLSPGTLAWNRLEQSEKSHSKRNTFTSKTNRQY